MAPGAPGILPRWTSSAKDGVGTALGPGSRVWFTHSHGILNEVYSPRIDQACIRDLGLIVTDGQKFFSEEKRHTNTQVERLAPGVPAYRLINQCKQDRYVIEKEIFADPTRDTVLQRIVFQANASADASPYRLYALLAPHLKNNGSDNTAWVGDYKGHPVLFAERDGTALALACSAGWLNRSVGYVGSSDSWQDLSRNKRMTWFYERAGEGNVALTGEIPLVGATPLTMALGFGRNGSEAALRAISSLEDDYEELRQQYVDEWTEWLDAQSPLHEVCPIDDREACVDRFRISASVIRSHEGKEIPGAIIASLSIPWGFSKGDDDLGGYHLTWPRDLAETAGSLVALGAHGDARRVLHYLQSTQEPDGHWAQNMWLDGRPYWTGTQMDETALPILLVDLARREGALDDHELKRFWPMIRSAASFLVCNGPVTQQDRWEEDPGYSAFTLAAEISALLAAAEIAESLGCDESQTETGIDCNFLRDTADSWHSNLDRWIYATDTDLAREVGVEGYYVRITPPETSDAPTPMEGFVAIKNRPPELTNMPAASIVSPDALALVRFGLRAADDPRMVNTVKVIDHLLRVELPQGPCWYRYNDDGYGEQEDGGPFNGTGVGRAWPLLTGERAHYELAAGNIEEAEKLLNTFTNFASDSGLLPEQVWDDHDLPQHELFRGHPTGSAMPLVWAHAEYIKLLRSLRDGQVFDMPPQGVQRYLVENTKSPHHPWRFNHKCRSLPQGKLLRLEALEPAVVHWCANGTENQSSTIDSGLGIHFVDLPTGELPVGQRIDFRWFWTDRNEWEDEEFSVEMVDGVLDQTSDWTYDVISIGVPAPVIHGKLVHEPHNLGTGWVGFDFQAALGKPTKLVNDAAMQALGDYEGGRMLFLGLGTGLGSAMIVDGIVEPLELAHLPYKKKKSFEDYVGIHGLERLGKKKWRKEVYEVIEALKAALEVDYVVVGGGNAARLEELPPDTRICPNANAFLGGYRLWEPKYEASGS
ncbi:4-alpha-D-glucan glucohydrolase) (Glucan 1 [Durusdinium trenchii]|uniref:4-alpha-D-glucan glucohydrolase) (Glucan 1 n=1 Tax=Durusdinium trenchii TaxID=1381693 RepID=A0ABP0NTB2_9DINO